MKISVIGCGHAGAVHAGCLARMGHEVVGLDVDRTAVDALLTGRAPFLEPGLDDLLAAELRAGLTFSTDPVDIAHCTVHFVCVGTRQRHGEYAADLSELDAAIDGLLPLLKAGDVVVGRATVPVGTAERIADRVAAVQPEAVVAWNPEFLRDGFAVPDTLVPDRFVFGIPAGEPGARALRALRAVYAEPLSAGIPRVVTDLATAQLVKVAASSFQAARISFVNAMAELCEATGADISTVADTIDRDTRTGRTHLTAGLGFGGGLSKDIRAFMARAGELGVDQLLTLLREVDAINLRRRPRMVDLAREECDGSLTGRRITVLGAALKPLGDDVRDSPALDVAEQLRLQGALVTVTDPAATERARTAFPDLHYVESIEEAVHGAELLLLLTAWPQFTDLDPAELKTLVDAPRILDGRNVLDPDTWRDAGWTYRALGRP